MTIHAGKLHYATQRILQIKPVFEGQRIKILMPPPDLEVLVEGAKPPNSPAAFEVMEFEADYYDSGKKRILTWWLLQS